MVNVPKTVVNGTGDLIVPVRVVRDVRPVRVVLLLVYTTGAEAQVLLTVLFVDVAIYCFSYHGAHTAVATLHTVFYRELF
jgi:hypothetical protein